MNCPDCLLRVLQRSLMSLLLPVFHRRRAIRFDLFDTLDEIERHDVLSNLLGYGEWPRQRDGVLVVRCGPAEVVDERGPFFRIIAGLDRRNGEFESTSVPYHRLGRRVDELPF